MVSLEVKSLRVVKDILQKSEIMLPQRKHLLRRLFGLPFGTKIHPKIDFEGLSNLKRFLVSILSQFWLRFGTQKVMIFGFYLVSSNLGYTFRLQEALQGAPLLILVKF